MSWKLVLDWLLVIVPLAASAYYLNWIAYVPAASGEGTVESVLQLGAKWYGVPLAMVIQLSIWWAMPRLFRITPSPWIAALVWPVMSAICKVTILTGIKKPTKWDLITLIGMAVPLAVAWAQSKEKHG